VAQAKSTVARPQSSAVHCIIADGGTVQIVATRGIVLLDLQDRKIGTDGRVRYNHAALAMHLADAVALRSQLDTAIAEASPPRGTATADAWQARLPPETARWGRSPSRAVRS
jgi:hypothetical protein